MLSKKNFFALTSCLLVSTFASAGELGSPVAPSQGFRPVVAVLGGVAGVNASRSQVFIGTDDDVFTYNSRGNNKTTGFVGAFLGVEHELPSPNFLMQLGVEYDYFGNIKVHGINAVGIEPRTSTHYNYSYRLQTQQVLAVAKLLVTTHQIFHPYAAVGLGAAFNDASRYNVSTHERGSINLTPLFDNNTHTAFSYSLGLGVDTDITQQVRLGLGYRYSSFGKASLGDGRIVFNNYSFPTSFAPSITNFYANQFIAQISYLA